MRKVLIIVAAAMALAGCQTVEQDRALTGGLIGGAAGTVVGAAAGGTVGSAVAGGAIGAGAGALIGAATTPHRCYWRDSYGRRHSRRC